jgi:hypothetical protein
MTAIRSERRDHNLVSSFSQSKVCYSCCLAHCPDGCHLLWRVLSPAVRQDMSIAQGHRALGERDPPVTVDCTLSSCWNCRHCVVGGCAFLSQCVPLPGRSVSGREGAKGWFTKRSAPTILKVTSQRPSSRNHHEVRRDENPLRRAAPSSASGGQPGGHQQVGTIAVSRG